ncbi:hypothetical protein EUGRSUZ_J02335 [Eucalyptus grandis]|uniref:Uncharacterized protein n=2 Tax=Eucalyptus grandis TaxID=71139 RepID=A0ACC3J8A0_EUCGR|nr:hypothetical protein EUGRSUZ_J02335 [Eucalyptus grandis]
MALGENYMVQPEAYHALKTVNLDDYFLQRMLHGSMPGKKHALRWTRCLIIWPKRAPRYTRHLISFKHELDASAFPCIIYGYFVMSSLKSLSSRHGYFCSFTL